MTRYLRIHPKRYRPLELGRIDVFFYQPVGIQRDGRLLTTLQAHVELTYTFEPPRLAAEALGWIASANLLYSGIAMGRAMAELREQLEQEVEGDRALVELRERLEREADDDDLRLVGGMQ